jgi:hypothetical protein
MPQVPTRQLADFPQLPNVPTRLGGRRAVGERNFSVGSYVVPWRQRLRLASFKDEPFYVDQQGRSSGRRTVVHEYPKRDLPYSEDMGRHALRYQMTGYLIQAPLDPRDNKKTIYIAGMPRDYDVARDALERVLMAPSPGRLLDPYNPRLSIAGAQMYGNLSLPLYGASPLLFMCEKYTIIESREKGGFCQLEMSFVEAGIPGQFAPMMDTSAQVSSAANNATAAAADQTNNLQRQQGIEELKRQMLLQQQTPR